MGRGGFSPTTNTFNLVVQIHRQIPSVEPWNWWFDWASQLLWMATEGQFRIGRVTYTHGPATDPDLKIVPGNAELTGSRLGFVPGANMRIGEQHLETPSWLVHELAQYVFALDEEYDGPVKEVHPDPDVPVPVAWCVNDPEAAKCCVLQVGGQAVTLRWPPGQPPDGTEPMAQWDANPITDFCTATHSTIEFQHGEGVGETYQESNNAGEACWDTIKRVGQQRYPDMTVTKPTGAPIVEPVPPMLPPVTFVARTEDMSFELVLDRSYSMKEDSAIDGVRYAADVWIDIEDKLGNELGVLAYDHAVIPAVPLGTVNAPQAHVDVAKELVPRGATDITGALAYAKTVLASATGAKTIVLFSDGRHNTTAPPTKAAIEAYKNVDEITLHTVTFAAADRKLMEEIAEWGGGRHRHVPQPGNVGHTEYKINFEISELAAHVHSSELGVQEAELGLPSPEFETALLDEPGTPADRDMVASFTTELLQDAPDLVVLPVWVEEGITRVTFIANHRSVDDVFFYVIDPDDRPLDPSGPEYAEGGGHKTYSVELDPAREPGEWKMIVRRYGGSREPLVPVGMFAFAENPDLSVATEGFGRLHSSGDDIEIGAEVFFPGPLTGVDIEMWPEGNRAGAIPFQERFPGRGDYFATILGPHQPGSTTYIIQFKGRDGTAESEPNIFEVESGNARPRKESTGRFERTRREQLHIAPLPTGADNDAGGLPDGCCGAVIRWLIRVCRAAQDKITVVRRMRTARLATTKEAGEFGDVTGR